MKHPILLPLAAALMLIAGTAAATQQGIVVISKWKTMDKCARLAQLAHPDFTAESNAKREAQLKACLNSNNLPPHQD
jgi:hypothetical protein